MSCRLFFHLKTAFFQQDATTKGLSTESVIQILNANICVRETYEEYVIKTRHTVVMKLLFRPETATVVKTAGEH